MLRFFKQYYPIRNLFFTMAEGIYLFLAVLISSKIVMGDALPVNNWHLYMKALLIAFICLVCLYYNDSYNYRETKTYGDLTKKLLQSFGASLIGLALIYILFQDVMICKGLFFIYIPVVLMIVGIWRYIYMMILKKGIFDSKIILIGSGGLARSILSEMVTNIDCGYKVSGIIHENGNTVKISPDEFDLINRPVAYETTENLYQKAMELGASKIVVALEEKRGSFPVRELLTCKVSGIDVIDGISFYEALSGKLMVSLLNPGWLIFAEGFNKNIFSNTLKRIEDIVCSIILLIVFIPVILVTIIFIKCESKGPLFYSQERLGKRKKPYKVFKFRSMVQDAEKHTGPVFAQKGDSRVTKVGTFIRKWRVDEIPQLINVLMGNMSLVGPRPERKHFVDKLEAKIPFYTERFSVKPGLTGWAQVCYGYGDSDADAEKKLDYELFYVKNRSIFMDIVIIFRTVRTVLFGVGAR